MSIKCYKFIRKAFDADLIFLFKYLNYLEKKRLNRKVIRFRRFKKLLLLVFLHMFQKQILII